MSNTKFFLQLFVGMFLTMTTGACQNSEIEKFDIETGVKWQEQIEYARRNNTDKDIKLVGFSYRGKIDSREQILEVVGQLFADDAEIVMYSDSVNYKLFTIKHVRQSAGQQVIAYSRKISDMIKEGMGIIDLEWSYKGRTVHSLAICSDDDGIVYDHIGCNLIYQEERTRKPVLDIESLKTRSESENGRTVVTDIADNGGINIFGDYIWEYRIHFVSSFDNNGILRDRSCDAEHHAVYGWSCDAQVAVIGGEINQSDYCEYVWGWAYSNTVPVYLTWNGVSFSVPSGAKAGNTGRTVHRL